MQTHQLSIAVGFIGHAGNLLRYCLYPAADRAGQLIAVEGPSAIARDVDLFHSLGLALFSSLLKENKDRKKWIIDGRDSNMPAGTDDLACCSSRSLDAFEPTELTDTSYCERY